MSIFLLALLIVAPSLAWPEKLKSQDEIAIATIVLHHLQPPRKLLKKADFSLSINLDGRYSTEVLPEVSKTYQGLWMLVPHDLRFVKENCFFDRQTRLPSLGIDLAYPKVVAPGIVDVHAGSAICVMGSSEHTYRLSKRNGVWRILGHTRRSVV